MGVLDVESVARAAGVGRTRFFQLRAEGIARLKKATTADFGIV